MNSIFNTESEEIRIPYSKSNVGLLFLGSICFVTLGFWFVINPSTFANSGLHPRFKLEIIIMGLICIIFFGACAVYYLYRFFDPNPGLIIDMKGIIDNSSAASMGFIKWDDITKISMDAIGSEVYIMVHVSNPEEYIDRQQSSFKKKSALTNYKKFDAPIAIITTGLRCDFNELYSFLTETVDVYKDAAKI